MTDTADSIHLHQQRYKLRAWIRTRLWAQVVFGMLLDEQAAEILGNWLALPGQIFLGLIAMVLVPLVFTSIVGGLTGAQSGAELKAVGLRLAGYILATTFAAAWIGVGLARWLQPGAGLAGTFDSNLPEPRRRPRPGHHRADSADQSNRLDRAGGHVGRGGTSGARRHRRLAGRQGEGHPVPRLSRCAAVHRHDHREVGHVLYGHPPNRAGLCHSFSPFPQGFSGAFSPLRIALSRM